MLYIPLVIGIIFFFYSLYLEKGGLERIVAPRPLFSLFFSLVYFLIPVMQYTAQADRFGFYNFPYQDSTTKATLIILSYFIISFIVSLIWKLNFNTHSIKSFKTPILPSPNDQYIKYTSLVFFLVGSGFVIKIILGYLSDFSGFMSNRINLLSGLMYPIKLLDYGTPAAILFMLDAIYTKKKYNKFIVLMLIISIIALYLMIGSRSRALFPLIFLMGSYILATRKKVGLFFATKALTLLIVLFMATSILGHIRSALMSDDLENIAISENENVATNELYTSFGNAELLAFVIDHETRWDPVWGYTYYASFVSFIPRALWKSKPVGGGPMLSNIVAPGAYKLGTQQSNSSLTTGVVLEAYLNGKIVMVIIVAILHGMMIGLLSKHYYKLKTGTDLVIYIITLNAVCMQLVNAEFLGVFTGWLFVILPLFIMKKMSQK